MSNTSAGLQAIRAASDRFTAVVTPLDDAAIGRQSYATEWSIAQVASHLGSQAEIFETFVEAWQAGRPPAGPEAFQPVWDRWNAKTAREQVDDSVTATEAYVARLDGLSEQDRERFSVSMFGMTLDFERFAAVRQPELALHTWDIAVALDPAATLPQDAVDMMIDGIAAMGARAARPESEGRTIVVETTSPQRFLTLITGPEVSIAQGEGPADLTLSAEKLIRLVAGRLTATEAAQDPLLPALQQVFPGF